MARNLRRATAHPPLSPARPSALTQVRKRRSIEPGPGFAPLPAPREPAPHHRGLGDVIGAAQLAAIERRGILRFHCVGDTGGWRDGLPQSLVAGAMVDDLEGGRPVDFFYHLGDVVYPHGEEAHYGGQFFSPYERYHAPIFAVPGNHDGEAPTVAGASSLEPFLRTFCSPTPPLHDAALTVRRPAANQPHVHWTLVHDWVRIIGLYTNVPEDGEIASDQLDWLTEELATAPPDVTLILAMHRPVYSVDIVHGSNLDLGDALDACFDRAGRVPDAVFGAHTHSYQRFSRRVNGRVIPYAVAGSGGFHERHAEGSGLPAIPVVFPGLPDVMLEAHQSWAHGYMTVTVTPEGAEVVYRTVSPDGAHDYDAFAVPRGGAA